MDTNNMSLWDAVSKTKPSHTKEVNLGRKFHAIDPYQQIKAATEQFGPAGKGWGWEVRQMNILPTNLVAVLVRVWHGKPEQYIEQWGQAGLYIDKAEQKKDGDPLKKATTDGLTKCLSYLGFNADIFLGMYDDNRYVAQMRAEEAASNSPRVNQQQVEQLAKAIEMSGRDLHKLLTHYGVSDLCELNTIQFNEAIQICQRTAQGAQA